MTVEIRRGKTDRIIEEIRSRLESYARDHPRARIDLYRQNSASVRARIIDPDFDGMSLPDRSRLVWDVYLDTLSDHAQGEISALILLTPEETKKSLMNLEFEDPTPSHF